MEKEQAKIVRMYTGNWSLLCICGIWRHCWRSKCTSGLKLFYVIYFYHVKLNFYFTFSKQKTSSRYWMYLLLICLTLLSVAANAHRQLFYSLKREPLFVPSFDLIWFIVIIRCFHIVVSFCILRFHVSITGLFSYRSLIN